MNISETSQASGSNQANKSSAVGHCWLDIGFRYRTNVSSVVRPVRPVDIIRPVGPLSPNTAKGPSPVGSNFYVTMGTSGILFRSLNN